MKARRRKEALDALRRRAAIRMQGAGARNPERAAAADPEPKPPEAPEEAVDGAGSSSEAKARQSGPAAGRALGPESLKIGNTGCDARGAGGSPAPARDPF